MSAGDALMFGEPGRGTMRATRGFVPAVVLALAIGSIAPAGASVGAQQKCSGPAPTTQSGRAALAPGLNGSKHAQDISITVSLFSCSPARTTRGSGSLKSTIKVKAPQTCELLHNPHTLTGTAVITWKDEYTSTIPMTFALTGASQYVNVTGTVTKGLFKDHPVTGQLHYAEIVSPHGVSSNGPGIAKACKNKTQVNHYGRISVVTLTFVTTKGFVVH